MEIKADGIPLTLSQIQSTATVYMVPDAETPEHIVKYIDDHFEGIFTTELASWSIEEADYPQDMSLKAFWELFEIEVHDLVLDITDEDLQNRHVPE